MQKEITKSIQQKSNKLSEKITSYNYIKSHLVNRLQNDFVIVKTA